MPFAMVFSVSAPMLFIVGLSLYARVPCFAFDLICLAFGLDLGFDFGRRFCFD
jgi:hypothetical protein